MKNFENRIQIAQDKAKKNDVVLFFRDGHERHRGIILERNETFAKIYRPKKDVEDFAGDVSCDSTEWFPFCMKNENKEVIGGIILK